ncbi:MAG: hypothetical protein SVE93_03950 [Candidatus Thermoplasmatota archaeon]|nr:hypothetical protein [Candidatus Thermoplasmatota archaeon]
MDLIHVGLCVGIMSLSVLFIRIITLPYSATINAPISRVKSLEEKKYERTL